MRIRRHVAALLLLSAVALVPTLGIARPIHVWTAGFEQAACIGSCCLVTGGFFELSCGEYVPDTR